MKVVVTGATGLIGRHLTQALAERGDHIVALTRGSEVVPGAETLRWDPRRTALPAAAAKGADAIINLAGASVGGRWTDAYMREILDSRVTVTRRCVDAVRTHAIPTLINASAMGWYGVTDHVVDERGRPGDDFLSEVAQQWEKETERAADGGVRVVRVRSAHVLAADGGLLPRFVLPARFGLLGPLGSGRQWLSWIHIDDTVAVFLAALDGRIATGVVNAVAPETVTQIDFARALGRRLHRPAIVPAPTFALRILLGRQADIVVTGTRMASGVLRDASVELKFPRLDPALADLLR